MLFRVYFCGVVDIKICTSNFYHQERLTYQVAMDVYKIYMLMPCFHLALLRIRLKNKDTKMASSWEGFSCVDNPLAHSSMSHITSVRALVVCWWRPSFLLYFHIVVTNIWHLPWRVSQLKHGRNQDGDDIVLLKLVE